MSREIKSCVGEAESGASAMRVTMYAGSPYTGTPVSGSSNAAGAGRHDELDEKLKGALTKWAEYILSEADAVEAAAKAISDADSQAASVMRGEAGIVGPRRAEVGE